MLRAISCKELNDANSNMGTEKADIPQWRNEEPGGHLDHTLTQELMEESHV